MLVTAIGEYTTKGGQRAVVETLNPAIGYIYRADGTTTKHVWQPSGRHGANKRTSQVDIVAKGFADETLVIGGYAATCRRNDGTTFVTRPLATMAELANFLHIQGWSHMVVRCDELRSVGQVDLRAIA